MYPEIAAFESTLPTGSGDPAQNATGHGYSGFALKPGLPNAKKGPYSRAPFLVNIAYSPTARIVKAAAKFICATNPLICGKKCGLFAAISQTNFLFFSCQQQPPSDMRRKALFININFVRRRVPRSLAPGCSECVPIHSFPQSPMNAL